MSILIELNTGDIIYNEITYNGFCLLFFTVLSKVINK